MDRLMMFLTNNASIQKYYCSSNATREKQTQIELEADEKLLLLFCKPMKSNGI
jgi:hypothetical protein